MNNPRLTKKDLNLIKSSIRRVFSRSDLRRQAIALTEIDYSDSRRPRVTKWCMCPSCKTPTPRYLMECDHVLPICKITETLDNIGLDELADRVWCPLDNLQGKCKPCHKVKSKLENSERRAHKKKQKYFTNSNK